VTRSTKADSSSTAVFVRGHVRRGLRRHRRLKTSPADGPAGAADLISPGPMHRRHAHLTGHTRRTDHRGSHSGHHRHSALPDHRPRSTLVRSGGLLHEVHAEGEDRHGDPGDRRAKRDKDSARHDRIVTAFENDLNQAYVPGFARRDAQGTGLRKCLRRRTVSSSRYNRSTPRPRRATDPVGRAADRENDHVPPGGWALFAEEFVDCVDPLYDNWNPSTSGPTRTGASDTRTPSTHPQCCRFATWTARWPKLDRVLAAGAKFIVLPAGPALRTQSGRTHTSIHSGLGSTEAKAVCLLPHLGSSTTKPR